MSNLWQQWFQSNKVYKLKKKELEGLERFLTQGEKSLDVTMNVIVTLGEQMPKEVLDELKLMFKELNAEKQNILQKTGGGITKKNYIFLGDSYETVKLMMWTFRERCVEAEHKAKDASVDAVRSYEESGQTQKVQSEHNEKPNQGAPYYSACTFQVNTKNAFACAHDFTMERASFADSAASNSMEDSRIALDEKLLSKDGVGVIPDVDSPPNVTKKLSTDSGPTDSSSAPKSNPDSDTNTADDTPVYVSFASLSLKRDDDTISLASYQTCFDGIPESQEEENS